MSKNAVGAQDFPQRNSDAQASAKEAADINEPAFIEDDGSFTEVPEFITLGDSAAHVDPLHNETASKASAKPSSC